MRGAHSRSITRTVGIAIVLLLAWVRAPAQGAGTQPVWVTAPVDAPKVEYRVFDSAAVGAPVSYHVYLPDAYHVEPERRFPVLYWLHGSGAVLPGIAPIAAAFDAAIARGALPPLIIVFPNGLPYGMYTDARSGRQPVESMIVEDLIAEVDAHFRTRPGRVGRMLEGFSMGGYGAARLGFKYRQRFGAISILAGGPLQADLLAPGPGLQPLELRQRILNEVWNGDAAAFLADSPRTLAEQAANDLPTPIAIRQIVGGADPTLPANRDFHDLLERLEIAHDYVEVPGVGHSMPALLEALGDDFFRFHAQVFGPPPVQSIPALDPRVGVFTLVVLVAVSVLTTLASGRWSR